MTPTHAPEHLLTIAVVVAGLYTVLIVWLLRLMRRNRRREDAALPAWRDRMEHLKRGGSAREWRHAAQRSVGCVSPRGSGHNGLSGGSPEPPFVLKVRRRNHEDE